MRDTAGRALAEALDEAAGDGDPGAAARVMTRLAGLDGRGWLRLDEWARRTYWGRSPLGQAGAWPGRLTADNSGVAAVAGSMCRPTACTAALRYLRGYRLPPGVLADLDTASTSRSRRTALAIRQGMGPWDRVQADLTPINGQDPDLAETGRKDLLAWLHHDAAATHGRPSPGQAAQIAALLAGSTLTGQQRRAVAFVAGIRIPDIG